MSVPKLRFPEFLDSGDWEVKKLSEFAFILTEKAGSKKYILMSVDSGIGLISQIEKFGREIAGNQYKNYFVICDNDFAYNKSATKEYPEGFIAMYSGREIAAVPNSIFTCFRIQADVVLPRYLNYLFLGNLHGKWLKKFITVGARANGALNIDNKDLLSLPTPVPSGNKSLQEQQKIADCLTSIADRITAETQKLATLKAHKKGLTQQLFPAEGETLPKLRFPEFRDSGEWEETTIGGIGSFYYGKSAPKWSLSEDAPTRCVRYGELYTKFGAIISEIYSRTNIDPKNLRFSKGGEILVPRVGEKPEDFGKCCSYLPFANIAIGEMISVFETAQNPLFYTYYFRNLYRQFAKVVEGQNVKNLYYVELEPLLIYRPSLPEQQKIADCLTLIDEAIAAQTQKIATLKTHKKGLMQQLFPSI